MAILKSIPFERMVRGNKELAFKIGVRPETICIWKKAGKLNYMQTGRTIIYDSENLFSEDKRKRK